MKREREEDGERKRQTQRGKPREGDTEAEREMAREIMR